MPQIIIDQNLCIKDGLCAMTCTRAVFEQEKKSSIPKIDGLDRCFACGQCVSICSKDAISHSDFQTGRVNPIDIGIIPSYDQLMELIRSRRSKRLWKNKAVNKETIKQVLEAARFAPSGHNEQTTEFVVVQDKNNIREIASLSADYLGKLAANFKNPIGRMMMRFMMGKRSAAYVAELAPELDYIVKLFRDGTDWIVREPPALILFHADSAGGTFIGINANLALHNASLAAETLGLGCYYAGFIVITCDRDKSIQRLFSVPETHKIYGALALGYPRLKFNKWPDRNPPKVKWS